MSKIVRRPTRQSEEECDLCGELSIVFYEWQLRRIAAFDVIVPHRVCRTCVERIQREWQRIHDDLTIICNGGAVSEASELYRDEL